MKYLSCVGRKVNKVYIIIFIIFSAILQPAGQIVLLSDVKVKVRIITAEEEGQTLRVFFLYNRLNKVPLSLSLVFCFHDKSSNVVN